MLKYKKRTNENLEKHVCLLCILDNFCATCGGDPLNSFCTEVARKIIKDEILGDEYFVYLPLEKIRKSRF